MPRGFLLPHLNNMALAFLPASRPLQHRGAGFHITIGTFATCRLRRA